MNRLPIRLRIVFYKIADLFLQCVIRPPSEWVFWMEAIRASLARSCETLRARREEEETL